MLARFLPERPDWVRGKRVLDFGCGSGVVAIAAARAGASEVIACDIDPLPGGYPHQRRAQRVKPNWSMTSLAWGHIDLIIGGCVCMTAPTSPGWGASWRGPTRCSSPTHGVKDFDCPLPADCAAPSCTLPDLDESAEFRDVRIYLATEGESRRLLAILRVSAGALIC